MAFTLPNLPYPTNALEVSIDAQTMEIHHGRHHKAYVDNLNKALEGQTALGNKPIDQLMRDINQVPENIRQAVINNGGGHANHSMFWVMMAGSGKGGGELSVVSTPNQDNPLMDGKTPILGIDVWEHAYYLKYQNRRPDYLAAWWDVVDWDEVGRRFAAAAG